MGKRGSGGWQEQLMLGSQQGRRGNDGGLRTADDVRVRTRLLTLVALASAAIVAARLLFLQILSSGEHYLLSENNHVERKVELAERGKILDSQGVVLAEGSGGKREYPLGEAAAHLIGYMAEANPGEIGCQEGICYDLGEMVGRSGAERVWERVLKGKNGGRIVEVDAHGKEVRELGSNLPESGSEVQLSVDARLQLAAAGALKDRRGAVVALDMSGRVLALYSSLSFDPAHLERYLEDQEEQYFLDRATGGTYPPGSIFKLVTAVAGLSTGKITPETLIEDTGEIRIDEYRYGSWYFDQYGRKEGEINVERALARSNDIFFYKVGELVGVDDLAKWAKIMGLGEETGIELPGEEEGLVPDRLWRERTTGEKWFLGNTYHLAIGQGDLLVTPLQAARMTAAVVSGRMCAVTLQKAGEAKCEDLGLKPETMETVKRGMRGACAAGGTAFPFFDFVPPVLCKTGTAEHAGQRDEEDLPHAWITVAYPADNPEMVLTVLLESAGEGSYEAGPVAREILSKWRDK